MALDKEQKAQIRAEEARMRDAAKEAAREAAKDPQVYIEFRNEEDPPMDGRPSPEFKFVFGTPAVTYQLNHGDRRYLPLSVVNHLNQLTIPVSFKKEDPVTGAMKTVIGKKNRCSCVQMPEPPKEKAKAKKQAKEAA